MKNVYTTLNLLLLFWGTTISLSSQTPTANFTYQPLQPCVGQPVIFEDSSANMSPNGYPVYSFGDGDFAYGYNPGTPPVSSRFVTHTYTSAGIYTVTYCIYNQNSSGLDTNCVSKNIFVLPGPCVQPVDTISGRVYFDGNANGMYEAGTDIPLRYKWVQMGQYYFMTDDQGWYQLLLYPGNYTVSLVDTTPFTLGVPATGTYTFNLTGSGTKYTGDFALVTGTVIQDLEVTLGRWWRYRPGSNAVIGMWVKNTGTIPMSGTACLNYDAHLQYLDNPYSGVHDGSNRKVTFSFTNLLPTQSLYLTSRFFLPGTVSIGTTITQSAQVNPVAGDTTPQNNYSITTDIVRASYDPNDKAASPGIGTEGFITPEQQMHYRIRFQNTGTDTAFNVYVIDTLDARLDIHSIEMLSASHDYSLSIDDKRAMRWQFDNILLPDSGTNPTLSNGFIEFMIKPVAGLADQTEIPNFADIYFDFNVPVRTNTVLRTILDKDSALFDLPTPYVQGLEGTLDFESLYPAVDVFTVNAGIGENLQDIQFFIQLDTYSPQLIGSTSELVAAGGIAVQQLSNFCIRNYYPTLPMDSSFRNSLHSLRFFAREIGKTNSLDSAFFEVTVANPLPAALLDFAGYVDQQQIQLNWTSVFEENTQGFIVQKYLPTRSAYVEVGRLSAFGSANTVTSYELKDPRPLAGINSYRLLHVDVNGLAQLLSERLEVKFGLAADDFQLLQVFPHPFEESTRLRVLLPASGKLQLEVFDLPGKRVYFSESEMQAGLAELRINLRDYPQGTYLYYLTFDGQLLSGKMLKIRKE